MIKRTRAVWMEVNMDNLAHNCREIKRLVGNKTKVMAVIKADGEGHGAVKIGKTLIENGADMFAVAISSEGIQLRKSYKDIPILILGYSPPYCIKSVVENNLTQTIYSFQQAKILSEEAIRLNKVVNIHVKIDTGMNRIGMKATKETIEEIVKIKGLPNVYLEGMFTHFAIAEDREFTFKQVKLFDFVWKELEKHGIEIPIKHVSNSGAIIHYPELNYEMVRPGRIIYGYSEPDEVSNRDIEFKKVMAMKAEICNIEEIEAGEGVSYGLEYIAKEKTKIATLPFGYGDGFTGLGKAYILVKGEKLPVNIRVTMDMTMIEIRDIDVKVGDEVIIFGDDGREFINLEENTPLIGISAIGLLFWSGIRVPRVYISNDEIIDIEDKILES